MKTTDRKPGEIARVNEIRENWIYGADRAKPEAVVATSRITAVERLDETSVFVVRRQFEAKIREAGWIGNHKRKRNTGKRKSAVQPRSCEDCKRESWS